MSVAGRGDLYGCYMLRIPHCVDSRLTDAGELVSPCRALLPQNYFLLFLLVLIAVRG
jgi:hypothetical protein